MSQVPQPIFRAPMRSRAREARPGAGAEFGLQHGVVGIGEAVDGTPETVTEAIHALAAAHGKKAGRMVRHFAALPDQTFVWTRQLDGSYRLGRISGPWRYDDSPEARKVGIHHVRTALWSPHRFSDREVPAAVARTFARGGRNLQRTHDRDAERLTAECWRRHRPADGVDREAESAGAHPE
jgi:hypothetical protein